MGKLKSWEVKEEEKYEEETVMRDESNYNSNPDSGFNDYNKS